MPIELETLEEQQEEFRKKMFAEYQNSKEYMPWIGDMYYNFSIFLSNKLFDLTHNDNNPLPNDGKVEVFIDEEQIEGQPV